MLAGGFAMGGIKGSGMLGMVEWIVRVEGSKTRS
jgi:hypothetical protein